MFLLASREGIRDGRYSRALRDVNVRGERPIHLAARGGSVRMVRCLLDRGADVAAEDDAGRNALLAACEADSIRVATLVLAHAFEHGVDPVDVDAYTPARLRWMILRRSLPDIAAASRGGAIDPAAPDGASEQALVTLALTRLGLGAERGKEAFAEMFDDDATEEEFAEIVRDAFKRFDEDGSGSLDLEEIMDVRRPLEEERSGGSRLVREIRRRPVRRADADEFKRRARTRRDVRGIRGDDDAAVTADAHPCLDEQKRR